MLRPLGTVPLDFALHLLVFAPLSRCKKRNVLRTRGELERVTALAATDTAQDESYVPSRTWMHTSLSGVQQGKRSKTKREMVLRQPPRDLQSEPVSLKPVVMLFNSPIEVE
jgi:hypothetical protein